jgi:chemotaxis protein methyltransferase CheR
MEMTPLAARSLAGLLEQCTGQQLATGRRWRIDTALQPVMRAHGIASLDQLATKAALSSAGSLRDDVVEALLNHETSFFRDLIVFRSITDEVLPLLAEARAARRRLRIWSAGCSTGQEAYTIAMMIADRPDRWRGWTIDLLGTDLSPAAIERAKQGRYSQFEIQRGLPVTQMLRRFDQDGEHWQASTLLRQAVRFRVHNLLTPPPVGMFDVVLCRNVLLYFSPDVRTLVFSRIASAMQPDGLLMLGAGETVMGQTDAFVSDFEARGLYRKRIDAGAAAAAR